MTQLWWIQVPLGDVAEGETKEATIFYAATWPDSKQQKRNIFFIFF